jgi:hypothetical protein
MRYSFAIAILVCAAHHASAQLPSEQSTEYKGAVRRDTVPVPGWYRQPISVLPVQWPPPPVAAPILSAIIPGFGQLTFRQDRFALYGVVEAVMWAKFFRDRRDQSRQESEYRALARQTARAQFSASAPDGDWDYYEAMERNFMSGEYSLSATTLVPDTNPTTNNGRQWVLAQRNHGIDPAAPPPRTSPEYQAALDEYAATAVKPEFLWSWKGAQLEWDIYRRTINKRNDAAHAVGRDVTILLANHVLSMVDAFVTYRLRVSPRAGGGMSMSASVSTGGMFSKRAPERR